MANQNRGEVPITLDKERMIRFRFNAHCDFQSVTGVTLKSFFSRFTYLSELKGDSGNLSPDIAKRFLNDLGENELRACLWAGLRHEDRSLSLEDVGDLIEDYIVDNDGNEITTMEKIGSVFQSLFSAWYAESPKLPEAEIKKLKKKEKVEKAGEKK